jgi:hypothetical protein
MFGRRDTLPTAPDVFGTYRSILLNMPLSAVWRGYGSAIFLEFGALTPRRRRDGTAANPYGDVTVMIEWSWRVEDETSIVCGSWSDEEGWEDVFQSLIGRDVRDVSLHGRLPELSIALTGGHYVSSFMTSTDQPVWTIFNRMDASRGGSWLEVYDGKVCEVLKAKGP